MSLVAPWTENTPYPTMGVMTSPGRPSPTTSSNASYGVPPPAASGPPPPYGVPPTPYGAPRTPRAAPRRSGAEVAHLILVILALVIDLAASLLDVVTSFTEGASGPVPHILSSLLFNAPLWLILGALLQSLRRRPSAFATAACVAALINLTASASVFRPLLEVGLILVLLIILILGVAAALSIASNHRLDGRPAGVTLAAGTALGILARFLMSLVYLAVAMTTPYAGPYAGPSFFIGPEIGPWMALWPKGVDLPPNAAWALAIVSALAAAVALSVLPRSRGTRAWARLSLGALVSTALLVTLGAVPLSPVFYRAVWNLEPRTGVAAILVGGPLLAAVSLAFLPSCRRWFLRDPLGPAPARTAQDRSTQFGGSDGPTPAGSRQGP
ncbi:hypothetical protein [Actinomyces gerencseriae]|uniref:hypothetical protein n=1 Tax=Actinomyces gerencseriae TaxID=52769 RepID=UPI0028EC5327|nr:hypothetical protein [Actinomyces gerencseriae]